LSIKLNTREKVKTRDPDIFSILTNQQYRIPNKLPDSDYGGFKISIFLEK